MAAGGSVCCFYYVLQTDSKHLRSSLRPRSRLLSRSRVVLCFWCVCVFLCLFVWMCVIISLFVCMYVCIYIWMYTFLSIFLVLLWMMILSFFSNHYLLFRAQSLFIFNLHCLLRYPIAILVLLIFIFYCARIPFFSISICVIKVSNIPAFPPQSYYACLEIFYSISDLPILIAASGNLRTLLISPVVYMLTRKR